MSKLRIAIDMDDVCVDFLGGLRAAVKTEFGIEIPEEAIAQWDLHPVLDPIIGRSWWSWLQDREWLWANFPAVDGAMGGIERLHRDGHYLEIVTSKPEWARHNVFKWLGKWRPSVDSVIIVGIDANKAEASTADLLIDDKPQNCLDFVNTGRKAILLTRPHNMRAKTPPGIVRAMDWMDILHLLETTEWVKAA